MEQKVLAVLDACHEVLYVAGETCETARASREYADFLLRRSHEAREELQRADARLWETIHRWPGDAGTR